MEEDKGLAVMAEQLMYVHISVETLWKSLAASGRLDVPLSITLIETALASLETDPEPRTLVRGWLDGLATTLLDVSKRKIAGERLAPEPTKARRKWPWRR